MPANRSPLHACLLALCLYGPRQELLVSGWARFSLSMSHSFDLTVDSSISGQCRSEQGFLYQEVPYSAGQVQAPIRQRR